MSTTATNDDTTTTVETTLQDDAWHLWAIGAIDEDQARELEAQQSASCNQ